MHVDLYSGAAQLSDGRFVPLERTKDNDLAAWTTVSPDAFDIRSSDEATATVTIDVPRDASAGERYGVVWAQLPASTPSDGGTSEVNRVGIRIYLSVGTGGEPSSDFDIDSLTAQRSKDGTPVVVARVRNTGGRALDMSGSLRLTNGPAELTAGPFPAKLGTTLGIGQTEPVTVRLNKQLPNGPWDATMTLRSGLTERSATATIRFPEGRSSAAQPVKPESSGWVTPVLAAIVAIALLVSLLWWFRWRKRRRETTSVSER